MKQQEILFFLGSICVLVFAWIAFTIVHNSYTSTIGDTTSQIILPINSSFDTDTIKNLQQRLAVTPAFTIQVAPEQDTIISQSGVSPSPVATTDAHLATQGGTLR